MSLIKVSNHKNRTIVHGNLFGNVSIRNVPFNKETNSTLVIL